MNREARDDAGVIAIIVALSISTFLLGFAALAVDLGSAYARKAELQSIANRLTLAGARGLPSVSGALAEIDRALAETCQDEATPGVCRPDGNAPGIGWATDGQAGNGEVFFFVDPDGDGRYRPGDRVDASDSAAATAVRVRLADSTVEFGLAGALGVDSARLTRSATGRIGTPLGDGLLPFALTPADLVGGQFCVSDTDPGSGPASGGPPDPTGPPPVDLQFADGIPGEVPHDSPTPVTLDIALLPQSPLPLSDVQFHFLDQAPGATVVTSPDPVFQPGPGTWRVAVPVGGPGSTARVWATGTQDGRGFVSSSDLVRYTGSPPVATDRCAQPTARRGFVRLARRTGDPDAPEQNIRRGPDVRLLPATSAIGSDSDCAATDFVPATRCLVTVESRFGAALTAGFLDPDGERPGRMIGDCGNGTTMSHSRSGVDDSHLFTDPGFITVAGHFSASELRARIIAGVPAGPRDRGWLTSKVLTCPRLAVLPVIDPLVPAGPGAGRNIVAFRYVWIDDDTDIEHRGLNGDGSAVTGFRGYVIDPGYLPAVVSGSAEVGPFLGGNMPKEAMLMTDLTG